MYIEYTWPPYFIPALGLSLKSVVSIPYLPWNRGAGAPSSRAAPGVVIPTAPGGLGGDGASSAVPRCFQCCIQFLSLMLLSFYHSTTRFMLSCSCWLSNDACYIPWFYQLRVFYAKCFVRNDEINCEIKSINNFVPQTYQFPMLHSAELDEMIYFFTCAARPS